MFEAAKRSQRAIDDAQAEYARYDRARRNLSPDAPVEDPNRRLAIVASFQVPVFAFGAFAYDDPWARGFAALACLLWLVTGVRATRAWRSNT
ncbi:MAG: hypothetical protein J7513_07135 [Solirubrobacteraceae bacterium]|nr:hypothetical protein [Solirubrobacteraceae bacterium]